MNEDSILKGIRENEWIDWEGKASVYYWNYSFRKKNELNDLIRKVNPHTVFVNGLYSFYFNIMPVWYSIKKADTSVVWSARGMLHTGALAQKAFKKRLLLSVIKLFGIHKKVVWHATDEREQNFIQQKMGAVRICIAGNYPNLLTHLPIHTKNSGELILGTIALISPMKNHKAVIEALQNCKGTIKWLIYGPVKDEQYWNSCLQLIRELPQNIQVVYKGELPPSQLSSAFNEIQVFIMPSESENFGHAIIEALSAGKPVITTITTPFHGIGKVKAGIAVELNELPKSLTHSINYFSAMAIEEYSSYSKAAVAFASSYISIDELTQRYQKLFQINV